MNLRMFFCTNMLSRMFLKHLFGLHAYKSCPNQSQCVYKLCSPFTSVPGLFTLGYYKSVFETFAKLSSEISIHFSKNFCSADHTTDVPKNRMAKVPRVKLSNGKEVPIIGLGTLTNDMSEPGEVLDAVRSALDVGYRHVDCAFRYQNEDEVGLAVREAIARGDFTRDEVFITSKLWNTYHRRERVLECCQKSLSDLELDYLDLYLIHSPVAYKEGDVLTPKNENGERLTEYIDFVETWKGMEDCYEKGLVKSIGLSNFNSLQIQRILDVCKIKPVMLQVECHPYLNQNKLIDFCKERDIAVTAYSPLGSPHRPWMKADEPTVLEDNRIKELAAKYHKTPAQICLRFNIQRGVIVIPKSVTRQRIQINFQVFDFSLTDEEMNMIKSFKETFRYTAFTELSKDKNFPFNVEF